MSNFNLSKNNSNNNNKKLGESNVEYPLSNCSKIENGIYALI